MRRLIKLYTRIDISFQDEINTIHNYASFEKHFDTNVWVHRKGAISARKDEIAAIPGSCGTASYIVKGLGNPLSFLSASHGSGRRMGRKDAERRLSMDAVKKALEGLEYINNISKIVDESPLVYKDIEEVMAQQSDLVQIVSKLKPIAFLKGE